MDLHEFLQLLRRRWRWMTAVACAGLLIAGVGSLLTPSSYQAGSSVFFSLRFGDSADDLAGLDGLAGIDGGAAHMGVEGG